MGDLDLDLCGEKLCLDLCDGELLNLRELCFDLRDDRESLLDLRDDRELLDF
ncbi:1593_t:CDS:2, partial [Racocetra fulgida]